MCCNQRLELSLDASTYYNCRFVLVRAHGEKRAAVGVYVHGCKTNWMILAIMHAIIWTIYRYKSIDGSSVARGGGSAPIQKNQNFLSFVHFFRRFGSHILVPSWPRIAPPPDLDILDHPAINAILFSALNILHMTKCYRVQNVLK